MRSRLCRNLILPVLLGGGVLIWQGASGSAPNCERTAALAMLWTLVVAALVVAFLSQRLAHHQGVYETAWRLVAPGSLQLPTPNNATLTRPSRWPYAVGAVLMLAAVGVLVCRGCPCVAMASPNVSGKGLTSPAVPAPASADALGLPRGTVGPFVSGSANRLEPSASSLQSLLTKLCPEGQELMQVVLVGSADKFDLSGSQPTRYGGNEGLARARAEWVRGKLAGRTGAADVWVMTVGPAEVGSDKSARDTAADRGVEVRTSCRSGHSLPTKSRPWPRQ